MEGIGRDARLAQAYAVAREAEPLSQRAAAREAEPARLESAACRHYERIERDPLRGKPDLDGNVLVLFHEERAPGHHLLVVRTANTVDS